MGYGEKILVLATGGTLGGVCHNLQIAAQDSPILKYFRESIRPAVEIAEEVLFLKDSRDITAEDRELILDRIIQVPEQRLIVTHGTYTLAETARYLQLHQERFPNKTVVIVGAFTPMGEIGSDSTFNLGYGCAAASLAPVGVWVAMQSALWSPDAVEKNLITQRFEPKQNDRL